METTERAIHKSFIVMLNLIAWMFLTAAVGIGAIHVNECTIQPHIPVYLIMVGASGGILLILVYVKNTIHGGAMNHTCTVCITCSLCFNTCWVFTGMFWVYSIYPPNTDSSTGKHYCQKTMYLYALWFNNLCLICVFLVFICCICYVLYKFIVQAFGL